MERKKTSDLYSVAMTRREKINNVHKSAVELRFNQCGITMASVLFKINNNYSHEKKTTKKYITREYYFYQGKKIKICLYQLDSENIECTKKRTPGILRKKCTPSKV